MPILLKNISAEVLKNYTGNVYFFTSVSASVQFEDYVNLNNFTAYLQNFTEVYSIVNYQSPINFGLKNKYNLPIITLQISY